MAVQSVKVNEARLLEFQAEDELRLAQKVGQTNPHVAAMILNSATGKQIAVRQLRGLPADPSLVYEKRMERSSFDASFRVTTVGSRGNK